MAFVSRGQAEGYRQLEDASGRPFSSLAAFCGAEPPYGLGYDPDILVAIQNETRAMLLQEKMQELVIEATPKEGRPHKLAKFASLSRKQRAEAMW